jgi:hypothetical protein
MSEELEVKVHRTSYDSKIHLVATFEQIFCRSMTHEIIRQVAEKVAERYVEEHYAEIVAKLDQQAIANLAVADSGKKIAEEIRTRPVVLREPGKKTVVNHWSLF